MEEMRANILMIVMRKMFVEKERRMEGQIWLLMIIGLLVFFKDSKFISYL